MTKVQKNKPVNNSKKPEPPSTLTPKQIELANMLTDPEHKLMTKTDMATKLKISRPTLYTYLERKDLIDYANSLLDYYTDGAVGDVWKALIKTATKGNVGAIKLFFEMKQMYVPPQQVAELTSRQSMTNINIISNIPRPPREGDTIEED